MNTGCIFMTFLVYAGLIKSASFCKKEIERVPGGSEVCFIANRKRLAANVACFNGIVSRCGLISENQFNKSIMQFFAVS